MQELGSGSVPQFGPIQGDGVGQFVPVQPPGGFGFGQFEPVQGFGSGFGQLLPVHDSGSGFVPQWGPVQCDGVGQFGPVQPVFSRSKYFSRCDKILHYMIYIIYHNII